MMDDNTDAPDAGETALAEEAKRQDRITKWFTFLSPAAEILSWLLLLFYLGISIYSTYNLVATTRGATSLAPAILTGPLYTVLIGLFYFLVLQTISKGIEFLLDIRESIDFLMDNQGE